jgi:hypothetical protein
VQAALKRAYVLAAQLSLHYEFRAGCGAAAFTLRCHVSRHMWGLRAAAFVRSLGQSGCTC